MRSILLLALTAFLGACASSARIVNTDNDLLVSVGAVARAVGEADVVALGEMHETPAVHRTHHALIEALHARRPNMVIAMEMFERDVQTTVDLYLNGALNEEEFRARSRPWPHYERDYRPVIEFAKDKGIPVLAANAPRPLARQAAKEGVAAVLPHEHLARETTAPKDAYWDAFNEMMDGHAGMLGEDGMERYYAAQCLKDDTMAESITDHIAANRGKDPENKLLAVLICGHMHSDFGRGAVQRIRTRMPGIDVRVLSAESVEDLSKGIYESPAEQADFVVVCREPQREERAPMASSAKGAGDTKAGKPTGGEVESAGDLPTENPEGMRPALGFMPDYAGEIDGVAVGEVREGGPAEAGGIEAGDVIVALDGIETPDLESYMEVLDTLIIGRNVTVRVQRAEAQVDLEVRVGSRPDR